MKFTLDHVKAKFADKGYTLLSGEYFNARLPLRVRCDQGHIYTPTYDNFSQGHMCSHCARNGKVSLDKLLELLSSLHYEPIDISTFANSKTKFTIRCDRGHIFQTNWNYLDAGLRCPRCKGGSRIPYEEIKRNIETAGYILLSGLYNNANTKLDMQCPKGHNFDMTYGNFYAGHRCPHCNPMYSKAKKEVLRYVRSIYSGIVMENDNHTIFNELTRRYLHLDIWLPELKIGIEYNGDYWHSAYPTNDKIKQQICEKMGIHLMTVTESEWKSNEYKVKKRITDLLRHSRNLNEIKSFLIREDVPYEVNTQSGNILYLNDGKLELRYVDTENHKMDYSKRFGIEGIPHNFFINITKANRDRGIRTIWIKDWEVEESKTVTGVAGNELVDYRRKWNVLQSYILTGTGHVKNRFYARDCEVREVPNEEHRRFLEEHCFYGFRAATVKLGLYLKKDKEGLKQGDLLMIYTFGHPFFSKGLYDVEVIRVGTRLFCQVIGGASKLLAHFMRNYPTMNVAGKVINVNKIVFIVDADHNDGRSLETLGFKFVLYKDGGFMNVDAKTGKVFHRQPMQHKLIMERMAKGEVYSVANAGSMIYVMERSEWLRLHSPTPML